MPRWVYLGFRYLTSKYGRERLNTPFLSMEDSEEDRKKVYVGQLPFVNW